MRTVLRFLFLIPIAFIAAALTAAFAMLWPFLDLPAAMLAMDVVVLFHTGIAFFAQTAQIVSTVILPWAVFMAVTEYWRLNGVLLHLTAGIVGAVAVMFAAYGASAPHLSVQTAILVAGIVFALVYWTVAGRSAGRWRRPREPRSNEPRPSEARTGEPRAGELQPSKQRVAEAEDSAT